MERHGIKLNGENIDFHTFDNLEGVKDSEFIEELEKIITESFPNSNFKSTFIGKRK